MAEIAASDTPPSRRSLSRSDTDLQKKISRNNGSQKNLVRQEIEQNIREMLSDDDSAGKPNETTGAKKKTVPQYVDIEIIVRKRTKIYLRLCTVAFLGLLCQIIECEMLYNNANEITIVHTSLKILGSIMTVLLLRLIYVYYMDTLILGMHKKIYDQAETLYSTKLYISMAIEQFLCAFHPLPFVDGTFTISMKTSTDGTEIAATYTYDAM